jgi:hypothetical protein
MTSDAFRDIALAMQTVVEGAHMGHPDFRANGRIFASLDSQGDWGTVKLSEEEQQALVRQHPEMFEPAAGAWGRQGWTKVRLDAADPASVRGAILLAWQHVMEHPPRRPAAKSSGGSAAARRTKRRQRR